MKHTRTDTIVVRLGARRRLSCGGRDRSCSIDTACALVRARALVRAKPLVRARVRDSACALGVTLGVARETHGAAAATARLGLPAARRRRLPAGRRRRRLRQQDLVDGLRQPCG